jgi:catechol 2,3-dioxygenase-like lactoylglutathione lyase family enzyme
MQAKAINPILNVTDIEQSFRWFEKLGWERGWKWGDPPDFAAVFSGNCGIYLCRGRQGSRGRGTNTATFGPNSEEDHDKGVWMSIWVDDVDSIYEHCKAEGIDVTWPPTDMPWNVREMHVRHPDGHVFRIGKGLDDEPLSD